MTTFKKYHKKITIELKTKIANLRSTAKNLTKKQSLVDEFPKCGKIGKILIVANNVLNFVTDLKWHVVGVVIISAAVTSIPIYASVRVKKQAVKRAIKYDVFLSYSSKDRLWVESTLLDFIESKGFKVCYGERDFPLGCSLVDTIARAVYESRKVIAVVSPNYLESGWCRDFEFLLTYTKILNKEAPSNSLLLIKYRQCQMPESMSCLKYLDYTRTCDNRNILMKVLSYLFLLYRKVDVDETTNQKHFFHDLLKWLGKPHVGKQCSVNKSRVARKKRPSRKRKLFNN